MTNNSINRREGFKVVVEDRWSLNLSGRKHDFDCIFFLRLSVNLGFLSSITESLS